MIKLTSKLTPHENINLDHRTVLKVLDLIENVQLFLPLKQKIIQRLVFKEEPKSTEEVKKQLNLFFTTIQGEGDNSAAPSGRKTLDVLKDYKYIYQSFVLMGIDLHTELMHWYKFNEILQGLLLTEDCPIAKVVEIRNLNPNDYEGKQRKNVIKLQKQFALEDVVLDDPGMLIMALKGISKPKKEVK